MSTETIVTAAAAGVATSAAVAIEGAGIAKPAKKAAAKKAVVVKPAAKVRGKAADLMATRQRVTFGPSFISGVLGGFQRDVAKIVLLGATIGVGTKPELAKLDINTLRERVGEAIMNGAPVPRSAEY